MTTNMRNAIEQAACEVGRALAKYEMLILKDSSMANAIVAPEFTPVMTSGNGTRKRGRVAKVATKAAETTQEPKAPVIARGVRKSAGPRTKGVKEAIMHLIATGESTTGDIVAKTGFKATSVNSTLMALKKKGIAAQDSDKRWFLPQAPSGNGDAQEIVNV